MPARKPVPAQARAFIGRGTAFRASSRRLRGTIIIIRGEGKSEPLTAVGRHCPDNEGNEETRWRSALGFGQTGCSLTCGFPLSRE